MVKPSAFPPIILSFTYNQSRQTTGMTYYLHEEEEHYRGLRLHCADRRCLCDSDILECFERLYHRLASNHCVLVLVEQKLRDAFSRGIAKIAGDNVTPLPDKAFELRDTELLNAFTKPPRLWKIGQTVGWDDNRAVSPSIMALIRFGNEKPEIVRSALALVKYLQTRYDEVVTVCKAKTRDNRTRIDFQFHSLDNVVSIDKNTLYALNVFRVDDHPSMVRQGRAKEGFSMNSFLECFVVSAGGRKLLREWCLQPTRDLGELRMRQESVRMLMMTNMRSAVNTARKSVAPWKSSVGLWANLSANVNFDNMGDWKKFVHEQEKLVQTLLVFERLDEEGLPCIHGISKALAPLKKSLMFVEMMLDFSKFDDIDDPLVRLKSDVDATLAEARDKYTNVSHYLNGLGVLEKEYDFESRGHFLPSFGFCVSMRPEDKPPPDFVFKFKMNGRLFFKTKYCKVIDEKLGGLYLEIRTRELHLLGAFVEHMRPVYDYWLETISTVYDQFDVLTGFAYCAAQYNWTKPIFVQKPVAHVERGTHPLVEHILDTNLSKEGMGCCFVPNDTLMGGTHAPIHVITGANSSGKSVYLKQVGLLHFLAHIGSYVPAKSCRLGLTDMIFSRIRTLESASVQLSAFEIDICQISRTLRSATQDSLVLVDEFGKGTRPDDGAALLASCILHLADRKPVPPRTVLTTHYPEIFTLKLVTHPLVQCYFMGTDKGDKKESGTRCLEYRYTLHPGVCVRSFGIECAEVAGIPSDILSRAIEIYNHLEQGDGVPTFEVKALRMLQGFDWNMGDKLTLVRRLRAMLQGKCVARADATPEPASLNGSRGESAVPKVETPPEYRNGLDPRGASFHCSTASMSSDNPLKRGFGVDKASDLMAEELPKRPHVNDLNSASPLLPHVFPQQKLSSSPRALQRSQQENLSPRVLRRSLQENLSPRALQRSHQENFSPRLLQRLHQENLSPRALQRSHQENLSPRALQRSHQENFSPRLLQRLHQENLSPRALQRSRQENLSPRVLRRSHQENLAPPRSYQENLSPRAHLLRRLHQENLSAHQENLSPRAHLLAQQTISIGSRHPLSTPRSRQREYFERIDHMRRSDSYPYQAEMERPHRHLDFACPDGRRDSGREPYRTLSSGWDDRRNWEDRRRGWDMRAPDQNYASHSYGVWRPGANERQY